MDIWPVQLFNPANIKPTLARRTLSGGTSLSGDTDVIAVDGGGSWRVQFSGIELIDDDLIAAWNAWDMALGAGTTRCVVPIALLRQAPRPIAGGEPANPSRLLAADADPFFPNASGFAAPFIVVNIDAAAALRATELQVTMTRGTRLRGGEPFTIVHGAAGERLYRVKRVVSTTGQSQVIKIEPPLREAVAEDTAADFDWPRFIGALVPDQDISPDLDISNSATMSITFREVA